jgi:hypothetical protein
LRGPAADLTGYLKRPANPVPLRIGSDSLAQDVAYVLAELGFVTLEG